MVMLRFRLFKILAALTLIETVCFSGARAPAAIKQRLDERMPVWLKAFNVTGVGIAYIEDGKLA